jgi:hypothetical protein
MDSERGLIMRTSISTAAPGMPAQLWSQRREATLNWLALGLLLAAWNAVDDGDSASRRPEELRGYAHVSVRAVARSSTLDLDPRTG